MVSDNIVAGSVLTGQFFTGEWSSSKSAFEAVEPATGAVIGKVGLASAVDIGSASANARQAQVSWAATAPDARENILLKACEVGERYRDDIVTWIMRESGAVRLKAEIELAGTLKAIRLAAAMPSQAQGNVLPSPGGRISFVRRRPLGVIGVISPFNFPLYLAERAIAPALAVGNAVVVKPDLRTAICGGFVIARLFELAGVPKGVLQVLPGREDAGEALCKDPNVAMIQFTGSSRAGRMVGQVAGQHLKKVSLELGGKNSLIILDDADLDTAVRAAAFSAFFHQGQVCMSAGRILVQRNIFDAFSDALVRYAKTLKVGNPLDPSVALGPMINQHQLNHALTLIDRSVTEGARLLTGGKAEGLFLQPSVLAEISPTNPAYRDELFAPVAVLVPFETDVQAGQMANDTEYGLSAVIISRNIGRAMAIGEQLRTGLLHINDQTINDDVVNPFGGSGTSGNGTSIGGIANWEEFTQWQWVTIKAELQPYSL
ncbi:benzaldehyde dehydrogenase (plasmid) [Bradyrhizobium sp. CCBAU 53351]|nr:MULTISPECIES: benzaldehyde dehydrogenase [Bradyrhizobium]QAU43409.1 benzaldehyde dehydrogenase [Bradyrhizobium guangdongense]QAU51246.1 benzaldehyde dehydrogenase [Bradyrhizobium guangzhouense]QOZ49864.1 benzaldehyde dehydrogenase [Bradyrhizobium sp. CCBAU 53340]QOZ57229.1 benzaldehyde dehydrogenase [Bradyrhizobium sp. CCBAU 53338]QOZ64937.1 benzaldehyde dehydrogenase [Bradyrhizobium guangdongense]